MGLGKAGRGRGEWKKCSNQTKYSSVFKFLSTAIRELEHMTVPHRLQAVSLSSPQSQCSHDPATTTASWPGIKVQAVLWPSSSSPSHLHIKIITHYPSLSLTLLVTPGMKECPGQRNGAEAHGEGMGETAQPVLSDRISIRLAWWLLEPSYICKETGCWGRAGGR